MNLNFCPHCFCETTESICPNCRFNIFELTTSKVELQPGTIIANRYKLGHILGIGGFGITYVGYDLRENKRYAIKEYMPNSIALRQPNGKLVPNSDREKVVFTDGLDLFLYETNILITLSGNRGIVHAENFVEDNNTAYLVMEYLDGISAKKLLSNSSVLDPAFALNVLTEVAIALRAVHKKGLLHRDISPENIMILKDGTVKLIDFGASRFFVGERSKSLSCLLKHGYAPPEQYSSSGNQGPWTDIYALAATYYKLVTGITLPEALSRVNEDTVARLDQLNNDVPTYIGRVIKKALALKPRDRYQTVDEFIRAMRFDPDKASSGNQEKPATNTGEHAKSTEVTIPQKTGGFWATLFGLNKPKVQRPVPAYQPPAKPNPEPVVPAYTPPPVQQPRGFLRIVNGASVVAKYIFTGDEEVIIGRDSSQCNIQVLDSSISRRHCTVRFNSNAGNFVITDYSSNGVFLSNGSRLPNGLAYVLNRGEFVLLSSQNYVMEVGIQ